MEFNLKLSEYYVMIGAISSEWNGIEHSYRDIIKSMFIQNKDLAEFLYKNLGNQTRWDLISRECKSKFPQGYVTYIEYFLKCAAICLENRNFLIHTKFEISSNGEIRGYKDNKSIAKDDWAFCLEKSDLEEVANEIISVSKYGKILNINLLINFTPVNWQGGHNIEREAIQITSQMHEALQQKPPLPRKIDQRIHRLS